MKIQRLDFVRNTALDGQRVLNFMRNSEWRIFLLCSGSIQTFNLFKMLKIAI